MRFICKQTIFIIKFLQITRLLHCLCMSNVFRYIHVSSFIANVSKQDWKEAALILIVNPIATLAFWIIIKYYQFTMMVSTIVLIAHYTHFLSSNEYVGTFVVFFQTINSSCIAIRFLLGSFKLDKRILSHCNDRVLKQHTCKHAYSTCHILYQCNNKRARWL